MSAALYESVVRHTRRTPWRYGFAHRTYLWLVDLDDLPRLPWLLRGLARFRAGDHVGDPGRSIRENLAAFLAGRDIHLGDGRVWMLSQPRVFGYVFNPLTVYWCHNVDGKLLCVVAEVHNTYGERHCYLLMPQPGGKLHTAKRFYVSPFFEVGGAYEMRLPLPQDRLHLSITLRGHGRPFTATLTGRRLPATSSNVLRLAARYPWHTLVIAARIRWHGIRLFLRGLPVVRRIPHLAQKGVQ